MKKHPTYSEIKKPVADCKYDEAAHDLLEKIVDDLNEYRSNDALNRIAKLQIENRLLRAASDFGDEAKRKLGEACGLMRVIEPFAASQACARREMKIYDACRALRPLIYGEPVAHDDNEPRMNAAGDMS